MISALCTSRGPRPLVRGRYSRPAGGCPDPIEKVHGVGARPLSGDWVNPYRGPSLTQGLPIVNPLFQIFFNFFSRGPQSIEIQGFFGCPPVRPRPDHSPRPRPPAWTPCPPCGGPSARRSGPMPRLACHACRVGPCGAACPACGPVVPTVLCVPPCGPSAGPCHALTRPPPFRGCLCPFHARRRSGGLLGAFPAVLHLTQCQQRSRSCPSTPRNP